MAVWQTESGPEGVMVRDCACVCHKDPPGRECLECCDGGPLPAVLIEKLLACEPYAVERDVGLCHFCQDEYPSHMPECSWVMARAWLNTKVDSPV